MYVRQSDRDFVHACDQCESRLSKLQFAQRPGRILDDGRALIDEAGQRMEAVVAAIDKEAVEASEARDELDEAEEELDVCFGDLFDGLVMAARLERLGSGNRQATHLPDVQRYLEGNTPARFAERARADKNDIMARALEYADDHLSNSPLPDEVLVRATAAQATFENAFEAWQQEEGDLITERNEADRQRAIAHREYTAGRNMVAAALELADSPQPLRELVPSLTDVLRGKSPGRRDSDESDDEDQPTEPANV